MGKVFEKLILTRLSTQSALIHPLQGGFKPRMSCMHTAFVLQEAIRSLYDLKKKAYAAFLDVRKAFDTVWHNGLFLKLLQFEFPKYLRIIAHKWYHHCTSSVVWNSNTSRSFPVQQGVRQGAVLSPLLYCVFVNDLYSQQFSSGHGVHIHDIFCGSHMYADDLALISHSNSDLQSMLDIVSTYAQKWRYNSNADKSAIVLIGESPASRAKNRPLRQWFVSGEKIPEKDAQHHLGILHSVSPSSSARTSERCSAGRSAFFSCNAVGFRFGCLHPVTTLRLYKTWLPILLYGSELWHITKTELLMLERVHRKILRTMVGLPIRCNSKALLHIMGTLSIERMIHQRQLNFLHSFSSLLSDSLHYQLLLSLIIAPPSSGIIPRLQSLVQEYGLPSMEEIVAGQWSKEGWKKLTKRMLLARSYSEFAEDCSHLPLAQCSTLKLGRPIPHLSICRGFPRTTCYGLEAEVFRFRISSPADSTCKLCGAGSTEDLVLYLSVPRSCISVRQLRPIPRRHCSAFG